MYKLKFLPFLLLLGACTGGTHYSPHTPFGSAPASALGLLFASTASGAIRTAGSSYTPNIPENIQILDSPPSWAYVEVGLVQAQAGPMVLATGVYNQLQVRAASIGADAVIVNKPFLKYVGRGQDQLISSPVKGIAIARPENVDK